VGQNNSRRKKPLNAMLNPFKYWSFSNFFRSPTVITTQDVSLPKLLQWWDLCAYGISNTVGVSSSKFLLIFSYWLTFQAGIFVVIGVASKDAGAGLFGSFIIASIAAFLSALCFMECATRFPGGTPFSSSDSYYFT
jgi:amino acid transporter